MNKKRKISAVDIIAKEFFAKKLCSCCGKRLTECYDTKFQHYLECKNCYAIFDSRGNYLERN